MTLNRYCRVNFVVPQVLLDHHIGSDEQNRRNFEPECLCSLAVDDQLVLGRGLYRQVVWILATKDTIDVGPLLA